MKNETFEKLVSSLQEGATILAGRTKPARRTSAEELLAADVLGTEADADEAGGSAA